MLAGKAHEVIIPDKYLDDVSGEMVLAQPRRHGLGEHVDRHLHLRVIHQVPRHGHTIAYALDRRVRVLLCYRSFVLSAGKYRQHQPLLPKHVVQI